MLQYKKQSVDLQGNNKDLKLELERSRLTMEDENSRLQAKIQLQEARLRRLETENGDMDEVLVKLEAEQQNTESLRQVNVILREQLDSSNKETLKLGETVQRLRKELDEANEESDRLREEKLHISGMVASDENKMSELWKAFTMLKRSFNEVRNETEKDLVNLKGDVTRSKRQMHAACLNLNANMRNAEPRQSLERVSGEKSQVEEQLREKVREMIQMQDEYETEKNQLKASMARLQGELDQSADALKSAQEHQITRTIDMSHLTSQPELDELVEQKSHLEQILRDIANCVIADTELAVQLPEADALKPANERSISPARSGSPSRRRRLRSPGRAVSPSFANSTYDAVAGSLQKRQLQVQELKAKLEASQDAGTALRQKYAAAENQIHELEGAISATRNRLEETINEKNDAQRDINRNQASLETVAAEKDGLNRTRNQLQGTVDTQHIELEKLRMSFGEAQQSRDRTLEERDELGAALKRRDDDEKRLNRNIELLEARGSSLREELVVMREQLKKSELERDVAEQDRLETSEALQRAEVAQAESELLVNRLRTDEAGSRDQLAKLSTMNEGLAADKVELCRTIAHLEEKIVHLDQLKQEVEEEKALIRHELIKTEQVAADLKGQTATLDCSLLDNEKSRSRLESEIQDLNRDKNALKETIGALERQQAHLEDELSGTREELEKSGLQLTRLNKEKGELTKEKATLLVERASSERQNRTLTEELAVVKSDKEGLETNLYEAQQSNAALEQKRAALEQDVQSALLRNEALQAEVARTRKEMQVELEKASGELEQTIAKLNENERTYKLQMKKLNQIKDEDCDKLQREKDAQRAKYEKAKEGALFEHAKEKEDLITQARRGEHYY